MSYKVYKVLANHIMKSTVYVFLFCSSVTNLSTRYSDMALVLSTWLGQRVVLRNKFYLQVYAKLGGKHLGQVELRKANQPLVEQVKDLEEQVAKLLAHPTRTSNYLALELQGFKLPSFTYRNLVDEAFELEALKRLEDCAPGSQLECMYDEDDSHALSKVQNVHDFKRYCGGINGYWLSVKDAFVPEIQVLNYTHNQRHLLVVSRNTAMKTLDCSPLSCLTSLERLGFSSDFNVKDWEFARHLPLKQLELGIEGFNHTDFECLPLLEELVVWIPFGIRTDLCMPARLPPTLKTVKFPWAIPSNFSTLEALRVAFPGVKFG